MNDSPMPPLLPEEQFRRTQSLLQRRQRGRRWLWFFLILSVGVNLLFWGRFRWQQKKKYLHESGSVFVERYLSGETLSANKIAVIRLEGIISSQIEGHMGYEGMVGDIKEQFRLADEDETVKAIILRIDSPGGEVLASDEIYRTACEVRDGSNGRHKKPVVCSMGSLAASGGFYAAMGADWILADNLTITGSIGVIMQTLNYKDLFGKIGLRSFVFKSGKFKDILNGSREPTAEEMDLVQNLIMETYGQFVGIVARERKLDENELRNGLADGRILSGKQAYEAKLINELGTFQDAIKKAKELAKIEDAIVSDYVARFSLRDLFGFLAESRAQKIQINVAPESMHLQQGKLYYLSTHLF